MSITKSRYEVKAVKSTKLKKLICNVCGVRSGKHEREVEVLYEIWLEHGAVPIVRICDDCKQDLHNITGDKTNDQSSDTNALKR